MDPPKRGLGLSREEIESPFAEGLWATEYPLVMTTQQVAKLLQLPIATIYQMSSQGCFSKCAKRVGKHLRFHRTRLLQAIFNN
jgi:excisionase family DNA binding protein